MSKGHKDSPVSISQFGHRQYQKLARIIHNRCCEDPGWCNYGDPEPPELADDPALPQEERAARAAKLAGWHCHCMAAVDAENIAAGIIISKSGKLKVRDWP